RLNIIERSPRSTASVEHPSAQFEPRITTENSETENCARIECAVRHTMDTVFFTPDQRPGSSGDAMSNDLMTRATRPTTRPVLETNAAANADEINEATEPAARSEEGRGGKEG